MKIKLFFNLYLKLILFFEIKLIEIILYFEFNSKSLKSMIKLKLLLFSFDFI